MSLRELLEKQRNEQRAKQEQSSGKVEQPNAPAQSGTVVVDRNGQPANLGQPPGGPAQTGQDIGTATRELSFIERRKLAANGQAAQVQETRTDRAGTTANLAGNIAGNSGHPTGRIQRTDASVTPEPPASQITLAGWDEFKSNLEYLASNIEDRDAIKPVVQTIAVQLARNPQFQTSMVKADFNLIVRGIRRAYAQAVRAKQEKRSKKSKDDDEMKALEAEFAAAGIKLG